MTACGLKTVLAFGVTMCLAGTVHAWPERFEGHGGPVKSIALSADGSSALSSSFDYSAIVWQVGKDSAAVGQRLIGHEGPLNDGVLVGKDMAATVSDDGSVALWNLATGEMLDRVDEGEEKMIRVAASADGRFVASASWDRNAYVYGLAGNRLGRHAVLSGHRGPVNAVAFLPDGKRLITASYDGVIRLFDADSGELQREAYSHGWGVNVLAVLPDGDRVVFGAADGEAGVISLARGEIVKILPKHERPVLSVALSSDLSALAIGDGAGVIRFYSVDGFALEEEFQNPYGPVWGLAISPDNKTVFYAGLDDSVKSWQVTPRAPFEPVENDFPRRFQVSETADPGELQFARKCSVCHTLTPDGANRAGPTLYGVFGRKVGSLPGYPYSNALRTADFVWSEKTISDLFDYGPDVVTPGSKMPLQRLRTEADRDALIAFLKRATAPGPDRRSSQERNEVVK
ncbi:c-type cytochrome [Stappia sp. F7233]|uniref:C-type cytochrome n=1 Tax=Stappia albiluteola TaxID=2758565 RepID=A0A839ABW1_9HYPH|nr:c-type cytochrome [Stappia albiluteola]MBA5776615.1 c-type cytochrome [Stappia albiluteola]